MNEQGRVGETQDTAAQIRKSEKALVQSLVQVRDLIEGQHQSLHLGDKKTVFPL